MKPETASLARALDDEFRRVAKSEDVPMLYLVKQVARALGCSERQLYNYRSGKWPIPSSYLPALCQRFNSRLLLDVLSGSIEPSEIRTAIDFDTAWALSKQLILRSIEHADAVLDIVAGAEFTRGDLTGFSAKTDSIVRDCRRLYSFAETAYEHAQERRAKTA